MESIIQLIISITKLIETCSPTWTLQLYIYDCKFLVGPKPSRAASSLLDYSIIID